MFNQGLSKLTVYNNFVIPEVWRIFRENKVQTDIVLPIQMSQSTEKWAFDSDLHDLKDKTNRVVSKNILENIDPLDYKEKYPYGIKVDYHKYSMKKCLDWLVANLNDDQWLLDDFRGEKSKLMDSKYLSDHNIRIQTYWAIKTVEIFFAKQEDMNLFKVLKENFKDSSYAN